MPATTTELPTTRAGGLPDRVWLLGIVLYLGGCLFVLGQGLVAVGAAVSPGLHEALHVRALSGGAVIGRLALRVADAAHRVPSWPQVTLDYVLSLIHLVLAGLLLWLRPRDRTARLLATALIGAAGVFNLTAQAVLEQLPMTSAEVVVQTGAHVLAGIAYVYALLLFPDGRPVPRWRRSALVPLYLLVTVGALALSVRAEGAERPAALLLFFGLVVPTVGAAAQAYRMGHTEDPTGQAQARLVFWALLPSVALGAVFLVTNGLSTGTTVFAGRHLPGLPVVLYRSFQVAIALIPFALLAGLLRYRLWDIERALNRTIVYAIATGFLGGVYVSLVVVVQQLLGSVATSPLVENQLAVAVTTLLLASVFRPVRDRIQTFVDRRFHRHRYDAQLTIEGFARRLRDQVAVEHIAAEIEAVLGQAIEPRHAQLWLSQEHRPAVADLSDQQPHRLRGRSLTCLGAPEPQPTAPGVDR
jgi:hypothetical protein